jgi:predicted Na+-dependent transporter
MFSNACFRCYAPSTGFFAQFLIMPSLGWGIAHLLKLDTAFAMGLILVA